MIEFIQAQIEELSTKEYNRSQLVQLVENDLLDLSKSRTISKSEAYSHMISSIKADDIYMGNHSYFKLLEIAYHLEVEEAHFVREEHPHNLEETTSFDLYIPKYDVVITARDLDIYFGVEEDGDLFRKMDFLTAGQIAGLIKSREQ